jgi:hypothetical protein
MQGEREVEVVPEGRQGPRARVRRKPVAMSSTWAYPGAPRRKRTEVIGAVATALRARRRWTSSRTSRESSLRHSCRQAFGARVSIEWNMAHGRPPLGDLQELDDLQAFRRIGETGFEPATARPPAGCATRLRHSPWLLRFYGLGIA